MATSPASMPLHIIEGSGFSPDELSQNIAATQAARRPASC